MKISTRLTLIAFLPIVVALLTGILLYNWTENIREERGEVTAAVKIMRQGYELEILKREFLAGHDPLAKQKWFAAYKALEKVINSPFHFSFAEENALLASIQKKHVELGALFSKLENTSDDVELTRLSDNFQEKVSEMIKNASELAFINDEEMDEIWTKTRKTTFLSFLAAAIIVGILSHMITRRLRKSVFELKHGTERLAAGALEFRITGNWGGDELGTLVTAFNTMAEQVHKSHFQMSETAAAFMEEVEVRKQAEEALKKLNRELESKVAERTIELANANRLLEQSLTRTEHHAYQARVLAEEQREHGRRVQELVGLAKELLRKKTMKELLQAIVDAARRLTMARYGVAGHGSFNPLFHIDASSQAEGAEPCLPDMEFVVDKGGVYLEILEKNTVVRLSDKEMKDHPGWRGLPERHSPLRGLLGAPLADVDGKCAGLIMVSDKEDGSDFTEEDAVLLQDLAELASLAMTNLKGHATTQDRCGEQGV